MSFRISFVALATALLFSLGDPLRAQIAPQPAATRLYRIAGTVVDSVTNQPIARANVELLSTPAGNTLRTVLSGPDGRFVFANMPAQKYTLAATRTGYRRGLFDQHDNFDSAIVTGEGQDTENLTIQLTLTAGLEVYVTDDFGEPVRDAEVFVVRRTRSSGLGEALLPIKLAGQITSGDHLPRTNDRGRVALYRLLPGDFFVAVSAHPWYALNNLTENAHPANPSLDLAYATTYYDGTTNEAEAVPVNLAPGAHERVSIVLHAVPAVRVSLQPPVSTDARPDPSPRLLPLVFGIPLEQPKRFEVEDLGDTGTQVTGVAPGPYELREGDPPRRFLLNLSGSQDLSPGAGTGAAALKATIKGVPSGEIPPEAHLLLTWSDLAHPRQPLQADITKNASEFDYVPPGNWQLSLTSRLASFPILETTVNGERHIGNRIHVSDRPLSVEILVQAAPTRIEGFATENGKGKPGVLVVLLPPDPDHHTDRVRIDQSDSDGSFTLRSVAPGTYTAIAIENGWSLEWQRPEILAPYVPGGVTVTVPNQLNPVYRLPVTIPIQHFGPPASAQSTPTPTTTR